MKLPALTEPSFVVTIHNPDNGIDAPIHVRESRLAETITRYIAGGQQVAAVETLEAYNARQ